MLDSQLLLDPLLQQICPKKDSFDKSVGRLNGDVRDTKCFLKTAVQSESVGLEFLSHFYWRKKWRNYFLLKFIFNFRCCQAHEGVKNCVEQYDRTSPLTLENWTWPKNLLLEQVCFHELAMLFFWAGRTDVIQAWLLARLWSQFSFVLWDSNF